MWMWWVWWVDVEVFLLLSLLLFVVAVDLAGGWWAAMVGGCGGCGMRGWMRWPAVLRIIGLRKRETEEREGKIKNDKERVFK